MALWTPAETTTALWLDAADSSTLFDAVSGGSTPADGGSILRLEDKSGNGRHATQSASGARPLRKASLFNSLDSLRFDGSDDLMLMDFGASVSQPVYVFAVTKKNGDPAGFNGRVFHSSSSISSEANVFLPIAVSIGGQFVLNFGTDALTLIQFGDSHAVYATLASGASSAIFRNGSSVVTASPGANALQRYCSIGGRYHDGLRNYNGDISEIVVLSSATATADRQIVEGYLAWKWGLQGNLPANHPYKNAAPAIGSGIIPILRQHYAAMGAR